jgi:hypothetical protein
VWRWICRLDVRSHVDFRQLSSCRLFIAFKFSFRSKVPKTWGEMMVHGRSNIR